MPEVRLIDANALIDKLDIMISDAILNDTEIHYALIRELIAEQTTIEPEVRRGRWIQCDALDYKDPNGVTHIHGMCSCCKLIYDFLDMTSRFKFCPDCGADMREVSEDA